MRKAENHKSIKALTILFCAVLFITSGCEQFSDLESEQESEFLLVENLSSDYSAQFVDLPACSGGLVLKINDDTIASDEIIAAAMQSLKPIAKKTSFEEFGGQAKPYLRQVLFNKISNVLIYQQAKQQAPSNIDEMLAKAVETEEKKFISNFGGNYAEAEKSLRQMGMDWKEFRQYQKKLILSQSYISTELSGDRPITHGELLDYYDEIKYLDFYQEAKMEFRLIDIQPGKLVGEDGQVNIQEQFSRARELAKSLREQIEAGKDFGELARKFSFGHRASVGGFWSSVSPGSLAKPYDGLEFYLGNLEVGEVGGPIEVSEHIFIVKLESKQPEVFESFEEVQKQVEVRLVMQRRKDALDKLMAKLMAKVDMGNIEGFLDFCASQIYYHQEQ